MQGTMGKKEERDSQSRFEVSIRNFWKRSFKNLSMKKKKRLTETKAKDLWQHLVQPYYIDKNIIQ